MKLYEKMQKADQSDPDNYKRFILRTCNGSEFEVIALPDGSLQVTAISTMNEQLVVRAQATNKVIISSEEVK